MSAGRRTSTARAARAPDRVHLLAHANPIGKDIDRFGFSGLDAYLDFIRGHLPPPLRLTFGRRILEAVEDPRRGGRTDDALRIRDLQAAIDDPRTLALVSLAGGGYLTRILPHLNFAPLAAAGRRKNPLWVLGFSELTTLANLAASYPGGRALYWLGPNYMAWKVRPTPAARAAFADFWAGLPAQVAGSGHGASVRIDGTIAMGRPRSGRIRVIGGCLSVFVPLLASPLARRIRPDGQWLAIEDVNEAMHRIDRHLAVLKLAGWFERLAGVLVGDFHMQVEDQIAATVELLKYHLPRKRSVPVITTRSFGHTWPISPLPLNSPLSLHIGGRAARIVGD